MLGHLGINVADLAAAKAHYDLVMPALGMEPFIAGPDQFSYRPAGARPGTYLFVYPATEAAAYSRHAPGLQHLAFIVRTRQAVVDAHELVVGLGCTSLHAPRTWPEYPPPYFAAFWLDPFGVMFEAVCHHDR